MALSRTARILIAILLLAAAAFFWVNFFYQSRLAERHPAGSGRSRDARDPPRSTPTIPATRRPKPGETAPGDAAMPRPTTAHAAADAPTVDPAVTVPDAEVPWRPKRRGRRHRPGDRGHPRRGPPTVVVDAPVVGEWSSPTCPSW